MLDISFHLNEANFFFQCCKRENIGTGWISLLIAQHAENPPAV